MINSYYQDTSSVDIGHQFESIRSEKPSAAAVIRHKIMGSVGNTSHIDSIENPLQPETNQKQTRLQRPQSLMSKVSIDI